MLFKICVSRSTIIWKKADIKGADEQKDHAFSKPFKYKSQAMLFMQHRFTV